MSYDLPESGFLAEDVRAFRLVVHREKMDSVSLLYRTNALAIELQHTVRVSRSSLPQACVALLYARTIASVQASVLLLEHGMPAQARMTLRSALETLFQLAAVTTHPETALDLLASHDADRRTIADRIRQWKEPALRSAIMDAITDPELDAMLDSKAKSLNVFNLAKLAGLEDLYLSVYTLLSFAVHGKVSELQAHVVVDSDGEPTEFKSEPTLDGQDAVWHWAIEAELLAIQYLTGFFSLETDSLATLRAELQALSGADWA